MGGERYEYFVAVGVRNVDTSSVAGATSYVPNNFPYGRLNIDSSGGMAPESPQTPSPYFDRRRIRNTIAVGDVGCPGRVKELDLRFGE